jgi:hypothetical protein
MEGGGTTAIHLAAKNSCSNRVHCSVLWNDQPDPTTVLDVLTGLAPLDVAEPVDYKTG